MYLMYVFSVTKCYFCTQGEGWGGGYFWLGHGQISKAPFGK